MTNTENDTNEPAAPKRLQRFIHPDAEVLDRAIAQVDPAIQHDILDLLAERLLEPSLNALTHSRQSRAIGCLREASRALGESPSITQYRKLRLDRPELDLVPDGHIRRWLGNIGWSACLERAHLEAVSDGDFTTRGLGGMFTDDELEAAARECFEEMGGIVPSWTQYYMWAGRPDVQARVGRRPKSPNPFQRLGGLAAVLQRLGLIESMPLTVRADGIVRPAKWSYERDDMPAALRQVSERVGGGPPRQVEYRRERQRIREETRQLLPCVSVIIKRYGSWEGALADAGFGGDLPDDISDRFSTLPGNSVFGAEDCEAALREAFQELRDPFTTSRYERWQQTLKRGGRRAPGISTIYRRFGTWRAACEAALGDAYDSSSRRSYTSRDPRARKA